MLHAPTSETKQRSSQSKANQEPQPEHQLYPRLAVTATRGSDRWATLHRTYGNRAVLRSLRSGLTPSASPQLLVRNRGISPRLQTKLTINTPGDQYEQEADRVAEQVMRMPDPSPAMTAPVLQRKCACGGSGGGSGQCSECAKKEELQRSAAGPASMPEAPPIVHEVLGQPGRPLDGSTRAFFEPRFGHAFGQVRVHTDAKAAASAKAVNALAYAAAGSQIVFGPGAYAPETTGGRNLIAHELAHVIQQSKHVGFELQRQNEESGEQGSGEKDAKKPIGPVVPDPDDTHLTLTYEFVKRELCGDSGLGDFCASKEGIMDWIKQHPDWHPGGGQIPDKAAKDCWPIERFDPLWKKCCPDNTVFDPKLINCVPIRPVPSPNTATCRPGQVRTRLTGKCVQDPFSLSCPGTSGGCGQLPTNVVILPVPTPTNKLKSEATHLLPTNVVILPGATPTVRAEIEILFKVGHPAEHEQDFDGALFQGDRTEFNRLLNSLKGDPAMKVQLEGRASIEGPGKSPEEIATFNRHLGEWRAKMVRAELVKNGITRDRIADPSVPDLGSECEQWESGVFTCGSTGAKNPPAQSDRKVMARVFKP